MPSLRSKSSVFQFVCLFVCFNDGLSWYRSRFFLKSYLPGWCRWSRNPCPPSAHPRRRRWGFWPEQLWPLERDRGKERKSIPETDLTAGKQEVSGRAQRRVDGLRTKRSAHHFRRRPAARDIFAWCSWSCWSDKRSCLERSPAKCKEAV